MSTYANDPANADSWRVEYDAQGREVARTYGDEK